uniref:RING-type domain-containing protein n=1 Tax=viral metagenome TaxID=1070528 RepID=A0A6C0IB28_9ZZZZ
MDLTNQLHLIIEQSPHPLLYYNDPRLERTFEAFITERNGTQEDRDRSLYSTVFNQLKNKIYQEPEETPKLTDEQYSDFVGKYYTENLTDNINRVKKLIVNFYNRKNELELKIDQNTKKFESFSKNILSSLENIDDLVGKDLSPRDLELKDILCERIEWYYSKLEIDSLKKEYTDILLEYSFFKKLIGSLTEVLPCGICQICLDAQVTIFIDPCGHTICTKCYDHSTSIDRCHFCRTKINSFKKIFL